MKRGDNIMGKMTDYINWSEVEALVETKHDNPHHILGPHEVKEGILYNVYFPDAVGMEIVDDINGRVFGLCTTKVKGFFSGVIKEKKWAAYRLRAFFEDQTTYEYLDPYAFEPIMDSMDVNRFNAGIHYEVYECLGAHHRIIGQTEGVVFAVWAPNAQRVSVVGDFNHWDGRRHPMRRLDYSGIYELFVPGVKIGDIYKFEIKTREGNILIKADPYANQAELRPNTASRVANLYYNWDDQEWMQKRSKVQAKDKPMFIYEMHLGSWKRPKDGREFYNYREIAPLLVEYIQEMGYTHVEFMPVMEHPFDPSWGYQVTGYYAPTSRYGEPKDFMYLIEYLHKNEIGVILDWVPAHFPKDSHALGRFDGTALYEHQDPRQGEHPHWGTYIFNYGRNEVKNFLIANALFWAEKYHVDGIRIDAVASMLYLDYGREEGQWIPNMYGDHDNLEAIEFLKHLNSVMHEKYEDVMMIAEESTAWPMLTHDLDKGGIGFSYKWNMGWMNDFINYMRRDPLFRKYHHGELTFSMVYAYSEDFVLVLSHDEVVHGKGSMVNKMPGGYYEKFANLRAFYGFMMTHPGKKLLFMGQDIAQFDEWNESTSIEWNLLEFDAHVQMKKYVQALNALYHQEPALYELDHSPEGFQWINCISANESMVIFQRMGNDEKDTLVVVCNFTPVGYENHKIGVPYRGKYKEIFNSDAMEFGGSDCLNATLKQTKKEECDGRENSIRINVAPFGVQVFKMVPPAAKKTKKEESK